MTQRFWAALAVAGSAAVLLGAYGFQYLGGLAPCEMCLWQRWPHAAAIVIGSLVLAAGAVGGNGPVPRVLTVLGALAALVTAGIGAYHTGVERGWWEGPSTCTTSNNVGAMSTEDLLQSIMSAPLVRCDEVPWELFGLSMASWNMLVSLGLAVIWVMAARTGR